MPKSRRDQIKQDIDTGVNQLQKAQEKFILVAQLYEPEHPDYYENYCSVIAAIETVIKTVEEIRKIT